jgi:aminopeptidase YwaD
MPTITRILAFVLFSSLFLPGQASPEWKVKPEWVKAHEMFLASDAMRGRGSASPDELITATYVASEFQSYGLKPGLPDGSYIQRVELVQPVLYGKAKITSAQSQGFIPLEEGKDFRLQRSIGESVTGPLQKIGAENVEAAIKPGAIVLLSGDLGAGGSSMIRRAYLAGAKAIVRIDPSLTSTRLSANTSPPSISPHLAGIESGMGRGFIIVALTPYAGGRLSRLVDGAGVSLQLKTKDTPRYSYNAVGVLSGKDTGATAKVILLSAHLDHLGIAAPINGDDIYNGADDDASGTTAVMELAHALAAGPTPERTIYFVCYGSEELGGLGSGYFREHSPVPLERIAANIEFEMIGNQDPKMPKGEMLFTGYDRSNLGPTLVQHGALLGNDPYPEQHFFQRSDNYPLALKGVVAHTAAGWGTVPTYHKPDDDLAHLDFDFLTQAIQSMVAPIEWLANSDFVPQWLPGGQPTGE